MPERRQCFTCREWADRFRMHGYMLAGIAHHAAHGDECTCSDNYVGGLARLSDSWRKHINDPSEHDDA
jgi:hypothetical protein